MSAFGETEFAFCALTLPTTDATRETWDVEDQVCDALASWWDLVLWALERNGEKRVGELERGTLAGRHGGHRKMQSSYKRE